MYKYAMNRYYSKSRPVAPGTYPVNGAKKIHNYDSRIYVEGAGCEVWGYVEYERELTPEEIRNYELVKELTGVEKIVSIIMRRDEISREEAEESVNEARTAILEAAADGDTEAAEEILQDELYLEPDYLIDLL